MSDQVILGASNAAPQSTEFKSVLTGMGEEKIISIFNPLPHSFRVVFARSKVTLAPPNAGLAYAREKAGLPLEKTAPMQNFTHEVVLEAQKTKNLPGDIAQKASQDLITFIIQTRNDDGSYDFEGRGGHKNMVSDPFLRSEIESEIIKEVKDAMAFFNQETPEVYTERQLSELNNPVKEKVNEQDPAPGTGTNYTPETTVPTGTGQPDTTKPEPAKNSAVPVKQ